MELGNQGFADYCLTLYTWFIITHGECGLLRRLLNIWRPGVYQGAGRMKEYFEGWYFKLADRDEKNVMAVIPGISFNGQGDAHCFIQVLNGKEASVKYFRYAVDSFSCPVNKFELSVGGNRFSSSGIELNLTDEELSIRGSLDFSSIIPWPVTALSPGAMGWYAFMPFMECYHGVLSFDHELKGTLATGGREIDFSGGRGYIEKDWGHSFPNYYIWSQSNHFGRPGISIMVSVANIPWLGGAFDGFIVGLLFENRLYQFTTYNGARITELKVERQAVKAGFSRGKHVLHVEARKTTDTPLAAPRSGAMDGRIGESLTSEIYVRLCRIESGVERVVFEGCGRNTGLEIEGNIDKFPHV